MSHLRLWILLLAATCFGAGLASGMLWSARTLPEPPGGAYEDYRRLFVARFELSPERAALFDELLLHYQDEVEAVRRRALEDSLSGIQPDLERLGLRYRDLIRDHVLPADRRAQFDELAEGAPWTPETPTHG